ncbi:MAG: RAD55 family ATPase [Thermoproteus sp.]
MELRGVTLIYGKPGTGKTTLAMSLASERLKRGEKVFWVSFYEDKETLLKNAAALGYDLGRAHVWDAVLADSESVFNYIVAMTAEEAPSVLVIDSISQLQGLDVRSHLTNVVYRALRPTGVDIVLIAEEEGVAPLNYIADNIVHLVRKVSERGVAMRYMDLEKQRGRPAGFVKSFEIIEGVGIVVLDEIRPSKTRGPGTIHTGTCIDKLIGGLDAGSSTLFIAPSTNLYLRFLAKMAADMSSRGLRLLFAARSVDPIKFQTYVEKLGGKIVAKKVEVRPERYWWLTYGLYKAVEEVGPDVLMTDWLDIEFALLGRDVALEIFYRNTKMLREAGIPLVASVVEERGLVAFSDNAVMITEDGGSLYASAVKTSGFEGTLNRCRIEL